MRIDFLQLLLPVLLLLLLLQHCGAEIRQARITSDSRPLILFHRFAFNTNGQVHLSLSHLSLHSTKPGTVPDLSHLGFLLTTQSDLVPLVLNAQRHNRYCIFTSSPSPVLFTLSSIHPFPSPNFTHTSHVPEPGDYGIFFASCQPHIKVSFQLTTTTYNLRNNQKTYLSLGETRLPLMYSVLGVTYLVMSTVWGRVIIRSQPVNKLHKLMLLLLVIKGLTLLAQAADLDFTNRTGTPHGWDVVYYLFTFFRGVMLFTVIILVGTGWSIVKPYLQEREKNVLLVVIPLQVLANFAAVVVDESGPSRRNWFTWKQLLLLVDVFCCCVVLFPTIWSIKHLREAARSDGKVARSLEKLKLFTQFYVFLIGYVYFTRIVVFALATVTDFRFRWTAVLAGELVTLAFYVFTGYKFRPVERNPYLSLDEEEKLEEDCEAAAAEEVLKEEDDFEL